MPGLSQAKESSDFYLAEADEPDDAARKIVELVCRRIPARFGLDPIREVQVLCPMNRGRVGTRSLNLGLQAALNGDPGKPAVERFGCSFRSDDKVMQTINDYDKEVFNGDLGFVKAVDLGTRSCWSILMAG
jgi:exodeoxyribonuclease V alpha subunit